MVRQRLSFVFPVVLALALVPLAASAQGGLASALDWLRSAQLDDGGFSTGFAPGSDIGATADAVVAIASAGESPAAWTVGGGSPLDYLERVASDVASPGVAAKVVLAAVAAGEDPSDVGGVDMVARAAQAFEAEAASSVFDRALAVLALEAAGAELPAGAVDGLLAARLPDGSYAFDGSLVPGSGDSNTTAVVVQALLTAGAGVETLPSYDYFRRTQNPDGGWTYQKPSAFGETTDANSTALVLQALLAGGQDLAAWGNPGDVLASLQQPSGAFAYSADVPGDNFLATVQTIPALAGVDLTDVPRLAPVASEVPSAGAMLAAAVVLLIVVLVVAAVVGRDRR